jgi:hypothetical protein
MAISLAPALPVTLHAQSQLLPDAPSALLAGFQTPQPDNPPPAPRAKKLPPCDAQKTLGSPEAEASSHSYDRSQRPCQEENPLQPIVTTSGVRPLTSRQKSILAVRDVIDPFALIVITGNAGVFVASNAHSAYGPGFKGFGRVTGYSLLQDTQGEFFGTFLIPVLAHEDPRYHRMPGRPILRRALHAGLHTFVSQHDNGRAMLNYATLFNYPIGAELSNLYVPGIATNGPSTTRRILLGIATDPTGGIIAEFLPDVARHIHIHIIFVQQILNQVVVESPN